MALSGTITPHVEPNVATTLGLMNWYKVSKDSFFRKNLRYFNVFYGALLLDKIWAFFKRIYCASVNV